MPLKLSLNSKIRDYEALFEETPGFIKELAAYPNASFVVDKNVWDLYSTELLSCLPKHKTIILPISENHKNLATVQELYDQIIENPAKRNLTLISIGGGILQDITGFTASTLYRGINWIFVPTTLLAQADSCIGSKTSLNYHTYKNLIGTFYPPSRIHIYTPFLLTQNEEDFYSGYGEVVKLHLLGGRQHFHELTRISEIIRKRDINLLSKVIRQSLDIKILFMTGDEFDTGKRNLLNYGHDFGHAVENTSNYQIPHGQAVIIGMLAANIVSQRRGLITKKLEQEISNDLLLPSLLTKPKAEALEPEAIIDAMKKDKKRTGTQLALILMNDEFDFMRVNDLEQSEVVPVLEALHKRIEQ